MDTNVELPPSVATSDSQEAVARAIVSTNTMQLNAAFVGSMDVYPWKLPLKLEVFADLLM
jgi:hypothetical protein